MPYTIEEFRHSPHRIPDATETSAGLLSITDKIKLDGLTPGGFAFNVTPVETNNYQAQPDDYVRADANFNPGFHVTLPPAAANGGVMVAIKSVSGGTNGLFAVPTPGDTIEGSPGNFQANGGGFNHTGTIFVSDGVSNWMAMIQYKVNAG